MKILPNFLTQMFAPRAQSNQTFTQSQSPQEWLGFGTPQKFGAPVDVNTSMRVAAVNRCVSLLTGVYASLDLGVYRDDPNLGRVQVPGTVNNLLTRNPFPGRSMNTFTWKETGSANLLLEGNWLSAIRYDGAARIVALEYVHPSQIGQIHISNGIKIYTVNWADGREPAVEYIPHEDMIHVQGLSLNGWTGLSKIRQHARDSIALARSIEEVIGRAHDNAMTPSKVVTFAEGTSPEAAKRQKADIEAKNASRENVGKTFYLDAGSTITSMSLNVTDLALLDAMQASVTQIAMFFGVPPILLGVDQTTSFGTGIASLIQGFNIFCVNSDLERIEAELTAKLCPPNSGQYIWFDRSQLLQMDAATAADVYTKEIACGISTINEVRKLQHKPRVENGDTPLTNSTNIPLSEAIKPRNPTPQNPNIPKPDTNNSDKQS